eukprot:5933307-Amphidinium_carterae.1
MLLPDIAELAVEVEDSDDVVDPELPEVALDSEVALVLVVVVLVVPVVPARAKCVEIGYKKLGDGQRASHKTENRQILHAKL